MKKSLLILAVFVSFLFVQCKVLTPIHSYKTINDLEAEKKALQTSLEETNAGIATLDTAIAHHTKTKQAMHDILEEAKAKKTQPDPKRMKAMATATGYRSKDYYKAPKIIRDLLDKFETDLQKSIGDSGTLATMAVTPGIGLYKGWYIQEISRTHQFLESLEKEKAKLIKNKAKIEARIAEIDKQIAETKARWKSKGEKEDGNGNGGY